MEAIVDDGPPSSQTPSNKNRGRKKTPKKKQSTSSVVSSPQKAPECRFFASPQGCARGDACRYRHEKKAAGPEDAGKQPLPLREPTLQSKGDKICFDFKRGGQCRRGAHCHFLHERVVAHASSPQKSSTPGSAKPRRLVVANDSKAALQNRLFGWRSFVTSALLKMTPPTRVQRLVFYNCADIQVSMLIRGAERLGMYSLVSAENEISIEREPFRAKYAGVNPIALRLNKFGYSVQKALLRNLFADMDDFSALMLDDDLTRLPVGRLTFIQVRQTLPALDDASVIRFDCQAATEETETVLIPNFSRRRLDEILIDFVKSDKLSIIMDPSLDNQNRRIVHEQCKKHNLKSKSDGQKGCRILTVWKTSPTSSTSSSNAPSSGRWTTKSERERRPTTKWEPEEKPASDRVHAPPAVRDNSNVAMAPVAVEKPPAPVEDTFWVCQVCEAENEDMAAAQCMICFMDREDEE